MVEITYEERNKIIELMDNITFKIDGDQTVRQRMAFTWEHLDDVDRFNLFMVGMMITGIVKEWKEERI